MIVKCVVACHNAQGEPDFFFVKIQCSEADYELGNHYDLAKMSAKEEGYEGDFVVFDESDGPLWLFQKFNWKSASVR